MIHIESTETINNLIFKTAHLFELDLISLFLRCHLFNQIMRYVMQLITFRFREFDMSSAFYI